MLECGWCNVYSTENPGVRTGDRLSYSSLSYGAGKDLVPAPGNKEWQLIFARKSSFF